MRKLLCLLAILALTAPLFAGSIVLTLNNNGNGTCTIGYESYTGTKPVGVALEFDAGSGETVSAQNLGLYDGPAADSFFDVFIDYAAGNPAAYLAGATPATGAWLGTAQPLAVPGTSAGQATLPRQDVSICMGSLVGTAPASVAALATLTIGGDGATTTAILDLDTNRGGIVDADGNAMTVTCKVNGAAAVSLPITSFAVTNGWVYPVCWGYSGTYYLTQCHGDSDGTAPKNGLPNGVVDGVDWPSFRDSLGLTYPAAGYLPCADYNRSGAVDGADWPQFRDNLGTSPAANCTPGDVNEIYKP